jgi:transcriptional regulator PpsR
MNFQNVKWFDLDNPKEYLRNLGADSAAALISAATDLALVIDADGIVLHCMIGEEHLSQSADCKNWLKKRWVDIVTVESRPKIESMLRDTSLNQISKWRQVNHPSSHGTDIPILYITVPLGSDGKILAIGKNAAPMAELQQQILQTHQSMEKKHLQSRQLETQYKMLFQMTSDAIFIVDAQNLHVLDANPAAAELLSLNTNKITGQDFKSFFDESEKNSIENLFFETRVAGRRVQSKALLAGKRKKCLLLASLFSQNSGQIYLIRASLYQEFPVQSPGVDMNTYMQRIMENAPDAFVVTTADGRVLAANKAFLELTQSGPMVRAMNQTLDRWFGRTSVDLNVMMANLQEHGSVRLFPTKVRNEYGVSVDVEISATRVFMNEEEPCFGFVIRDTESRMLNTSLDKQTQISRPVDQLAKLVGRMPLKELVQESTKMVERYCIEAALQITGENRTSAAELLGLSRQSLYVKLRRHGLGDLE